MSVVLQIIDNPPVSQGYSGRFVEAKLANTGNENVKNVSLKVIDAVIFSKLWILTSGGYKTCLNVSTSPYFLHNETADNYLFPAGTEGGIIYSYYYIKADAPIDVHDVETHFTYEVY